MLEYVQWYIGKNKESWGKKYVENKAFLEISVYFIRSIDHENKLSNELNDHMKSKSITAGTQGWAAKIQNVVQFCLTSAMDGKIVEQQGLRRVESQKVSKAKSKIA